MMDLNLYIAFFAATTIMILLPGPSVMLTVAHSISFGWRRALATVMGATIGVGIQLAITFGFTALWAVAAGHAGGAFRTRRGVRLRNRIAGSLMLGAGFGLALVRRS